MKKEIRLYTVDLDGTLLDVKKRGHKSVSKKNIDAIRDAKENSVDVVISTGRVGQSALKVARTIPSNYVIAGNGSEIYDKNEKMIFSSNLSIQQGLKILEIARKYKLAIKPDNHYVSYGSVNIFQKWISRKIGWKTQPGYSYPLLEEHAKFVLFGTIRKGKLKKARKELDKLKGVIAVFSFNGFVIEVNNENATKGKAAMFLANKLGLEKNEVAHVGDTMNDSTAKGVVGNLIVMKNGTKDLKKMATHIGPNYKNGGVAKILKGNIKKV